jgi:TusE/DsrC/DsvC family sulfur relay protein
MAKKRKPAKAARKTRAPAPKRKTARRSTAKSAPARKPQSRSRGIAQPLPQPQIRAPVRMMYRILHPSMEASADRSFRDAPDDWTPSHAEAQAAAAGLTLTEDHWEVIRVLQGCYRDEISPRIRLLRDALEMRFTGKGGMKYLFEILPGGPIAQGCALAGLKPPHGARDLSFGSVA